MKVMSSDEQNGIQKMHRSSRSLVMTAQRSDIQYEFIVLIVFNIRI
jgi:hypothetical protein